jgi:hypothetical protein
MTWGSDAGNVGESPKPDDAPLSNGVRQIPCAKTGAIGTLASLTTTDSRA